MLRLIKIVGLEVKRSENFLMHEGEFEPCVVCGEFTNVSVSNLLRRENIMFMVWAKFMKNAIILFMTNCNENS